MLLSKIESMLVYCTIYLDRIAGLNRTLADERVLYPASEAVLLIPTVSFTERTAGAISLSLPAGPVH